MPAPPFEAPALCSLPDAASPPRGPPLMRLRCPSESYRGFVSRYWLRDPSAPLPRGVGHEVFLTLAHAGPRLDIRRDPLLNFRPLQSPAAPAPAPANGNRHSPGVPTLSALEASGVHSTRACLTRYVPSAGFPTLLTAYSSRRRPALFHAGGTRRVSRPSEPSPPGDRVVLIGLALPACRQPRPGYRVLLPPEVRCDSYRG